MAIRFACRLCKSKYTVKDEHAGKESNCKVCGLRIKVPSLRHSRALLGKARTARESTKLATRTPIDSSFPHETRTRNFRTTLIAIGVAIILIIPVTILLVVPNRQSPANADVKVAEQLVSPDTSRPLQTQVPVESATPRPNDKEGKGPDSPEKKSDLKLPDKEKAEDPIKANVDRTTWKRGSTRRRWASTSKNPLPIL